MGLRKDCDTLSVSDPQEKLRNLLGRQASNCCEINLRNWATVCRQNRRCEVAINTRHAGPADGGFNYLLDADGLAITPWITPNVAKWPPATARQKFYRMPANDSENPAVRRYRCDDVVRVKLIRRILAKTQARAAFRRRRNLREHIEGLPRAIWVVAIGRTTVANRYRSRKRTVVATIGDIIRQQAADQ